MKSNIAEQIEKKKPEPKELEAKQKEEMDKTEWLAIPELGIEVEAEVHDKGKSWKELNLQTREDELLTAEQCFFLENNEKYSKLLKMDGSSSTDDFYIKQPYNFNKKKGWVAVFYVDSCGLDLDCYGGADCSSSVRGVRFVRKISKRSKK